MRRRARRWLLGALATLVLLGATKPAACTATPRFASSISTLTRERLGLSWRPGCPVAVADLRLVSVSFVGFDGASHHGELVVHRRIAGATVAVFRSLYASRFPIRRMETSEKFLGPDDFAADGSFVEHLDRPDTIDDTAAFMCRPSTGGGPWSAHAFGLAIDVNPLENPYVKGARIVPINAGPNVARHIATTGLIATRSEVVHAFAINGLSWGGSWRALKDYMHFTATGK